MPQPPSQFFLATDSGRYGLLATLGVKKGFDCRKDREKTEQKDWISPFMYAVEPMVKLFSVSMSFSVTVFDRKNHGIKKFPAFIPRYILLSNLFQAKIGIVEPADRPIPFLLRRHRHREKSSKPARSSSFNLTETVNYSTSRFLWIRRPPFGASIPIYLPAATRALSQCKCNLKKEKVLSKFRI